MNLLIPTLTCLVLAQTPQPATQPTDAADQLASDLQAYFKETNPRERRRIATGIESDESNSFDDVASALGKLVLWQPHDAGISTFSIASSARRVPDHVTEVTVHLPEGYDPVNRYPLFLALHDSNSTGEECIRSALEALGATSDGFIVAAPSDNRGVWLGSSPDDAAALPELLLELRRRFHVDADRVYVTGKGLGGHAAFTSAVLYTDEFAAAVPRDGTLTLQSGWEAVELMLPNLRHTPVLTIDDRPDGDGRESAVAGVAAANRYLAQLAQSADVPVELVAVDDVKPGELAPPLERLQAVLEHRRPHAPNRVEHWFRYPAQGRCFWLRQDRFYGDVWTSQQVVVRPALTESYSDAMTDELRRRLAYLRGHVEGQRIDVEADKCAAVDVLLTDDLVDVDKPVTVYLNGTNRFEDRVRRSIKTMLELAYEDWDFDRLFSARIRIPRSGLARQE